MNVEQILDQHKNSKLKHNTLSGVKVTKHGRGDIWACSDEAVAEIENVEIFIFLTTIDMVSNIRIKGKGSNIKYQNRSTESSPLKESSEKHSRIWKLGRTMNQAALLDHCPSNQKKPTQPLKQRLSSPSFVYWILNNKLLKSRSRTNHDSKRSTTHQDT